VPIADCRYFMAAFFETGDASKRMEPEGIQDEHKEIRRLPPRSARNARVRAASCRSSAPIIRRPLADGYQLDPTRTHYSIAAAMSWTPSSDMATVP